MAEIIIKCENVERLKGKVFILPRKKSDDDYETARNKLIPIAEKFANKECGIVFNGSDREREAWCRKWNRTFFKKMEELVKENGLN